MRNCKSLLTLILAVTMMISLLTCNTGAVPAPTRTQPTEPPLDAMTSATLKTAPANGQQVVVYYDAARAALSVYAHGNGLDATTATVNNSVSISVKTAEAALLTVETDGTFYRFASDSGYLCGKDGAVERLGDKIVRAHFHGGDDIHVVRSG